MHEAAERRLGGDERALGRRARAARVRVPASRDPRLDRRDARGRRRAAVRAAARLHLDAGGVRGEETMQVCVCLIFNFVVAKNVSMIEVVLAAAHDYV